MITRFMRWLAPLPVAHPVAVLIICLVLCLVAGLFVPRLYISTDRNLLAGVDNPLFKRRDEVNQAFGTTLVSAVVVQGPDRPAELRQVADELAAALRRHPRLVRDVFHQADISFFEQHALLFLSPEELARMSQSLERGDFGLNVLEASATLPALIEGYAAHFANLKPPEGTTPAETRKALTFFGQLVDDLARWARDPDPRGIDLLGRLWSDTSAMAGQANSDGYLLDKDGRTPRLAVLFVQPADASQAMEVVTPFTDTVRDEARKVTARHPGFSALVTGLPALTTDEMRILQRDILLTGILSALGVLFIFAITFRSLRIGLFLVLPLGVGFLWAAGFTAAVYEHLTMISGYFAAVLFGLGVAFTIYLVSRFHEALLAGEEPRQAAITALARSGPGVVGSATTTAVAFFAIAISDFQGFAEMGIIAGTGTVFMLTANLTLLPATLVLWHPGRAGVRVPGEGGAGWGVLGRAPFAAGIVAVLIAAGGVFAATRIGFDYAVESLLPGESESVVGLRLLESRTDFSSNYAVAVTSSLAEAERLRIAFSRKPTVARAEALSQFLPDRQPEKLAILGRLTPATREAIVRAAAAARQHAAQAGRTTTAAELAAALQTLQDAIEDVAFAAREAKREEAGTLGELAKRVGRARVAVATVDDRRVRQLERELTSGLDRALGVVAAGLRDRGFGVADLPATIRGRYLSGDQTQNAVIVYPNGDIGQRAFFEAFVADVVAVDDQATGHPVTHLAFTHLIHRGFAQAALFAALAVIVLILLDLRRPRDFALAVSPVVIGGGWCALVIWLCGLTFNYANLMAIPILIGTGVDFGINLAHRARQEGSIRTAVRTTGRAMVISATTTVVGFGSLLLGEHWGVRSLGIVLVLGIVACLTAALIVMPALLERRRQAAP